jgi:hypothetical protein
MAHLVAPNLRGKGISKTKFTKTGEPKRSGNWSVQTIHHQSLQSKDYPVYLKKNESGADILIAGEHTHLYDIMGGLVEHLAISDENFSQYYQEGEFKGLGNGKAYQSFRSLTKNRLYGRRGWYFGPEPKFTLRLGIYTDGDFDFPFPEY